MNKYLFMTAAFLVISTQCGLVKLQFKTVKIQINLGHFITYMLMFIAANGRPQAKPLYFCVF